MAYQNPTMDALSRGGAVANQGMSVANSMMQGVQKAMDSTSDLTFKLTSLLKNEEARKFNEGMAITNSLQNQYQFDITQKFRNDQLEETKRRNAADEALRGTNYTLNKEKFDYLKEQDTNEQTRLDNLAKSLNAPTTTNAESSKAPEVLADSNIAESIVQEENSKLGSDIPKELTPTIAKPTNITEAVEQNYTKTVGDINNQISNVDKEIARIGKIAPTAVQDPKAYRMIQTKLASLKTQRNTLVNKAKEAKDTHSLALDNVATQNLNNLATKFTEVKNSKTLEDEDKFGQLSDIIASMKEAAIGATGTKQKDLNAKIKIFESVMANNYSPEAIGQNIVDGMTDKYLAGNVGTLDGDAYLKDVAKQLTNNKYNAKIKKSAMKAAEDKAKEFKKLSKEHAKTYATINSLQSKANPSSAGDKGTYQLLRDVFKFGNNTTKDNVGEILGTSKDPGIYTDSWFDGSIFAGSFGADEEAVANQLATAINSDDKLNKAFESIRKRMEKEGVVLFETGIDNEPISDMNEDEKVAFFNLYSELLYKDPKIWSVETYLKGK